MHAASVPAEKPKADSIRSSRSFSVLSSAPIMWRRVKSMTRIRSMSSFEQHMDVRPPAPTSSRIAVRHEYVVVSGAPSTAPSSNENASLHPGAAYTCGGKPQQRVSISSKPLPKAPSEPLHSEKMPQRTLQLNTKLEPTILEEDCEHRSLSPLEQQILQCLHWLSRPSSAPQNILIQLGFDAFWMSAHDAKMLTRLDVLTEGSSRRQKDQVLTNLDALLRPQEKYALTQILRHGVSIINGRPANIGAKGMDGSSRPFVLKDERMKPSSSPPASIPDLIPEPLRVAKRLRRLSEESEPSSAVETNKPCARSGSTNARDFAVQRPGSVSKARASLPVRSTPANTEDKATASLSDGAKHIQHDLPMTSPPPQATKPGSVRNALDKLFNDPRPAPRPPRPTTLPEFLTTLQGSDKGHVKKPGSVRNARIAAEKALGHSVGSLLPRGFLSRTQATSRTDGQSGHRHSASLSSARGWEEVKPPGKKMVGRRSSRRQTSWL